MPRVGNLAEGWITLAGPILCLWPATTSNHTHLPMMPQCMWDAGGSRERGWHTLVPTDDVLDGMACARLANSWPWVHAAGRGCWRPATPTRMYTHTHKCKDNTKSQQSRSEDCVLWGVSVSLCVPSWKWHVSLRRGIKRLENRDEGIFCKRSTSNSGVYARQMFAGSRLFVHHKRHGPGGSQPGRLDVTVERLRSTHAVLDQCVKGDWGREASLRSRQHHTQVPEGVAPTQRSLPVTCIHQLPLGSGCHHSTALPLPLPRPGSCPGYPSLTPLSQVFFVLFFSHASFCHIMEYQGLLHFPRKKGHFLSHIKLNLNKGTELHSFWLVHFPPTRFFSPYFKLEASQPRHRSTETKHCYQESTSVLQMPTAIERLLSPFALANTFLTAPSFPPPLPICSSVHSSSHSRNH